VPLHGTRRFWQGQNTNLRAIAASSVISVNIRIKLSLRTIFYPKTSSIFNKCFIAFLASKVFRFFQVLSKSPISQRILNVFALGWNHFKAKIVLNKTCGCLTFDYFFQLCNFGFFACFFSCPYMGHRKVRKFA
jgi:hypothetical protein